jgi:hypothetical protein
LAPNPIKGMASSNLKSLPHIQAGQPLGKLLARKNDVLSF